MNDCQGVVTYKNEQLLYFKIEDVIVNAAIYIAHNNPHNIKLPNLGEKLNIKKAHFHKDDIKGSSVFTLCCKSKLEKFKSSAPKGLYYIWMVKDYKMGANDLFIVTNMYESVKDTVPPEIDLGDFISKYIEEQLVNAESDIEEIVSCENRKLPLVECKTISHCKSIQLRGNTYSQFPYWSFGNHWSRRDEVLIGVFFVHPKFGMVCFKDLSYTVGCVIVKNYNDDLRDILNKAAYVKKYCIFTEIFNPNTKFNLEYLFVSYQDIKVVDSKRKRDEFLESSFCFKMKFIILSKSYVTFSQVRGYHFWIEIEEIDGGYLKEYSKCLLCLPEKFILNWSTLELSYSYTIGFNENLQRISDVQYTRIYPKLPQYMLSKTDIAEISEKNEYIPPQDLPFLDSKTLPKLLDQKCMISFQAILKYRVFTPVNKWSSKTTQNIPQGFGTLGEKTHVLDFQVEGVKTICLYLIDWERIVMPIGLLPGAVVNVRNVIVYNRYLKSTSFTSLELVKYERENKFWTAKLFSDDDWGTPYFLGERDELPKGVLVYGVINSFFVKQLSIQRTCSKCSYLSKVKGKLCVKCHSNMELTCRFVVVTNDQRGPARVIMNDAELVQTFLNLKDQEWELWKSSFETVGNYLFQRWGKTVDYSFSNEELRFINMTSQLLKMNQMRPSVKIGLMCRKLHDKRKSGFASDPLWFGIRVKNIH